ncbi:MAG: DJ-1/PfpI family protein [Candidatus Micrarchaeia archaeon]
MVKVLMVVAPTEFRDEECFEPKGELEDAGIEVIIASKGTRLAKGKLGGEIDVQKDLSEVRASDYDAVVFVGGQGSAQYFNDPTALRLAREANDKCKIVAAICIAPSILANAGILKGKKATAYPSEEGNLRVKGAIYTGKAVEQDGKIITANGPAAARNFGKAILKSIK